MSIQKKKKKNHTPKCLGRGNEVNKIAQVCKLYIYHSSTIDLPWITNISQWPCKGFAVQLEEF